MSDEKIISTYPVITEKPEFSSSIPPHLLDKLTPQEKYMVETLSRVEQQGSWTTDHIIQTTQATRDFDLRLQAIENWKSAFTGKWLAIAWVATVTIPLLLKAAFEKLFSAKP